SAHVSLQALCTTRRLFLLLGLLVLLVGTAAGAWLLVKHLRKPHPEQDLTLPQEPAATAACSDEEEEPVVRGAPSRVSFRIKAESSLLEAQVEGHSGWLLACYEHWSPSLGTLLCQRLGYLRWAQQRQPLPPHLPFAKVGMTLANAAARRMGAWPWQQCQSRVGKCGQRLGAARVVGGRDVPLGRWPWQVSLYQGAQHHCGGSVVAPEWIVTAAHCVHSHRPVPASPWLVFAGMVSHSSAGQQAGVPVQEVISHPLYNGSSLDYDIALLRLQRPLRFSADAIRAVCLPPLQQDLLQGTQCWVSGWGYTRPHQGQVAGTLKEALVPLIGTKRCNSSCMYRGELSARMLCAGHPQGRVDACQGDSGGPLVCQDQLTWRLVGIVSWGQGCAQPNHPGVYTNVAQLLPWIHHTTQVSWS
ncbi:TMPS5 protease, partial [Ramphastos sulfuratus]|nr:TMPS5 protease [Ramphastos sulfuratus]